VSKLAILLVDNDTLVYHRLSQILQQDVYLQHAGSVAEARQQLAVTTPDFVITEVHFKDAESGLELCRYIRSVPSLSHLPIMILTSLATIQDKIAGFNAGADDYVVKPFESAHLVARIRLLRRIKHMERQRG
jgi:DNA-binding response OmpR family regulator